VVKQNCSASPPEMKLVIAHLTKQNILKLIHQKKILFWIIIMSFAVSVFGVLFYSGYFAHSYYGSREGEVCSVNIRLHPLLPEKNVNDIISDIIGLFSEAVVSVIVSDGDINSNYTAGNIIPIIGKYSTLEKEQVLLGRYFHENENNPVALVSESCAAVLDISEFPINEIVTADQNKLSIIGILFNAEYAYITPLNYYIENYHVTKISVLYNQNVSNSDIQQLIKKYNGSITNYTYQKQTSPFLDKTFLPLFIQILLIYSFTFINIMLVIALWQQHCLRRYKIYYVCGIQDRQLSFTIMLQIIFTSLLGILIGFASYLGLLPLFERLEIVKESFFDSLLIVCIVLLLVIAFSGVYCKKIVKKLEIYKNGE
jgi:hypothetical protein